MTASKIPDRANPYEITAVGRACELIRLLQDGNQLRVHELAELAGLSRTTTYRLLATLQAHGIVLKSGDSDYSLAVRSRSGMKYRIGYAAQSSEFGFSRAVTRGIKESASAADVDLIVMDNDYDPTLAMKNADILLAQRIDLIMEFQTSAQVAPLISAKARRKKVPMIAIEIPHPDATFFGVNNAQAGLTAGRYIAEWAHLNWMGKVDEVILLGLPQAGSLPESRLTSSLLGIREVLPNLVEAKISVISGNGQYGHSFEAMKAHLSNSKAKKILVSCINDPSALGALEAFKQAHRLQECAIVGQNGSVEARLEMRNRDTRLVGSVGYFPERYGEQLIALAQEILARRTQPPRAVFIKHQLLTPSNLKQYYRRENERE
jgi:ribose transport system substrate-binding protein